MNTSCLRCALCRRAAALFLVLAAGFAAPAALAGPATTTIDSAWLDTPIVIDGLNKEWRDVVRIARDVPFSIAVRNDDQRLYLALITTRRDTAMQAFREGLVIWFDVAGGDRRRLGIQYPVGRAAGATRERGQPPAPDGLFLGVLSDPGLVRAEIIGPGKDERRTQVFDPQSPIQARIGWAEGLWVYELAIPLRRTGEGAVGLGTAPGRVIGVGLETPERRMVAAPAGSGDSMGGLGGGGMQGGGMGGPGGGMGGPGGGMGGPGGGMGGSGGGMGGPGGGMGGPGGMGMGGGGTGGPEDAGGNSGTSRQQKRIDIWIKVRLARP
jgi:hypothetical protein